MGHCYHHALSSVRKWGGTPENYLPLHQWFDEPSKLITADFRHRALRHHAAHAGGGKAIHARHLEQSAGFHLVIQDIQPPIFFGDAAQPA